MRWPVGDLNKTSEPGDLRDYLGFLRFFWELFCGWGASWFWGLLLIWSLLLLESQLFRQRWELLKTLMSVLVGGYKHFPVSGKVEWGWKQQCNSTEFPLCCPFVPQIVCQKYQITPMEQNARFGILEFSTITHLLMLASHPEGSIAFSLKGLLGSRTTKSLWDWPRASVFFFPPPWKYGYCGMKYSLGWWEYSAALALRSSIEEGQKIGFPDLFSLPGMMPKRSGLICVRAEFLLIRFF